MANNNRVVRSSLHRALLTAGFERYSGKFKGNQYANNKVILDFEKVHKNKQLYPRVLGGLCRLVAQHNPDFVVGVPDGATGYADAVARNLRIDVIHLAKDKQHHRMEFATEDDRVLADLLQRGVLIEDVPNRRTSLKEAVDLLGAKVIRAVGIFDRGVPGELIDIGIGVDSLVHEPIPAELSQRHELWHFARGK